LTDEKIEDLRAAFIKRKANNPLTEKSARVSADTFIGRARALFTRDVIERVSAVVEIPEAVPFRGIRVEKVRVPRYRSTFDMAQLLEDARTELAPTEPEQYKIFLWSNWSRCPLEIGRSG
jgi:hypothetical protein